MYCIDPDSLPLPILSRLSQRRVSKDEDPNQTALLLDEKNPIQPMLSNGKYGQA